tara:strand:+ start:11635 stop:12756 length:1122 start_codon:yes stop_codon:yes gene_type:complete
LKLYVIAGEASGDLHGANLIKALKKQHSDIEIRSWGGDLMQSAGATVVKHIRDLAFMGFLEVILNLKTILGNISFCKKDIERFQPDAIILIDYPGFNLRIAKWAKDKGIKVFYYISPQIWAWNQKRGFKIKNIVDEMFVILPFEKEFYKKFDLDVHFVGHPLLDAVKEFKNQKPDFSVFCKNNQLPEKPIVALLPGSRKQEVNKMLPIFLSVVDRFPDYQFVLAAAPALELDYYQPFLTKQNVSIIEGKTYELLLQAKAALVSSGTATLETALFKVPEVVCYKGSTLSVIIARMLIKIKFISLVNLIMDQEIVTELIQSDLNKKQLEKELDRILHNEKDRKDLLANYEILISKLGGEGASQLTANLMLKTLAH